MSNAGTPQLVWFKRDLRVADHAPLREAASRGPCICLYVYEPSIIDAEDFDASHLAFINESLSDLEERLRRLGCELVLRVGEMPEVLESIRGECRFESVWCHEETGNRLTYDRDKRVIRWCREHGVAYHELPQNGVVRRLKSRDGWAGIWQSRMRQPLLPPPARVHPAEGIISEPTPNADAFGLPESTKTDAQRGGEVAGRETLDSFLRKRGRNYRSDMSSPVTGESGCSRLSPYLAWGCLSLRTVYHAAESRMADIRAARAAEEPVERGWLQSLSSFQGRLRWHCHFMQKLEDEPAIEFQNMNRAYDGLREDGFNEEYFAAWCRGETGYPMVDACMRALHQTGWINFRMRAMLVSFASYHLWLHWRRPAVFLARQFLDYEPGIHYSQFQMQSGTTGINTVRIYSPIKQALDQDPEGEFIRRYVPELAGVPPEYLPEPHKMPPLLQRDTGCLIGRVYPRPIVDHRTAYNEARRRIYARKGAGQTKSESRRVFQKHGSRRRGRRRSW